MSGRITRTGTRRCKGTVSAADRDGKAGQRQLSIPQMLLRRTERLHIEEEEATNGEELPNGNGRIPDTTSVSKPSSNNNNVAEVFDRNIVGNETVQSPIVRSDATSALAVEASASFLVASALTVPSSTKRRKRKASLSEDAEPAPLSKKRRRLKATALEDESAEPVELPCPIAATENVSTTSADRRKSKNKGRQTVRSDEVKKDRRKTVHEEVAREPDLIFDAGDENRAPDRRKSHSAFVAAGLENVPKSSSARDIPAASRPSQVSFTESSQDTSSRCQFTSKSLPHELDGHSAKSTPTGLSIKTAEENQTSPVRRPVAGAPKSVFLPSKRSPLKELNATRPYAPLPYQLEDRKKEVLFPVNRLWKSPLPILSWGDSEEVWQTMLRKEKMYARDADVLQKHPSLQARMRSILLDWLTEVCEVYKLHRETFYLTVDFVDRFLSQREGIPKQRLQLIGITALFVASKIEEIYPPKLMEFAFVTDGACTEQEILQQELLLLKALEWDLSPVTVNGWLNVFMQLTNVENIEDSKERFVFPQYSGHAFSQIAQLLDLCIMDVGCLKFPHNVLATSAIYHQASEPLALSVSGLGREDIVDCVEWMTPFAIVLREMAAPAALQIPDIPEDDQHNIQMHSVDLGLLDAAHAKRAEIEAYKAAVVKEHAEKLRDRGALTKTSSDSESFLTPPKSSHKQAKRP